MIRIEPVQDLERPELEPYRSMRLQNEQRAQGIFVAEGEKVVRRLLESSLEIASLLLPERWARNYSDLLAKRVEDLTVYTAEKRLLEKLTGYSMYQGVLAVGRVPLAANLDEVLERKNHPLLLVAVDGVSSAENMGGLVRNSAAFGVDALLAGESCCSPYMRRAVRSSMGTVFNLPIVEPTSLAEAIRTVRSRGVFVVAAHPHTDQLWLSEARLAGDCMIVLGSEGNGISPEVLAVCDEAVAIRMRNGVDSLNVGTAGAVFLYEASRQRERNSFQPPRRDGMV